MYEYSLTIRKEAELDINSAFEYYEIQRLGLGCPASTILAGLTTIILAGFS